MKKETALKKISKVIEKEISNETKEVKNYFAEIIWLTFSSLEAPCEKRYAPYTSTENLNLAIDSVFYDGDFNMILEEARKETREER